MKEERGKDIRNKRCRENLLEESSIKRIWWRKKRTGRKVDGKKKK